MLKLNLSDEAVALIKKILKVLGFLLSLIILIIVYKYLLEPEIKVNHRFVGTQCMVAYKKLEQKPNLVPQSTNFLYRPSILVFYQIKGKTYQAWTFDILRQYSDDKEAQQAIIDKAQIGKIYDCWYDLSNPKTIVLVKGYNFFSLGAFIIALITTLFLLVSIFKKS